MAKKERGASIMARDKLVSSRIKHKCNHRRCRTQTKQIVARAVLICKPLIIRCRRSNTVTLCKTIGRRISGQFIVDSQQTSKTLKRSLARPIQVCSGSLARIAKFKTITFPARAIITHSNLLQSNTTLNFRIGSHLQTTITQTLLG